MRPEKVIQKGCGRPRSARTAANIHWTGKLAANSPDLNHVVTATPSSFASIGTGWPRFTWRMAVKTYRERELGVMIMLFSRICMCRTTEQSLLILSTHRRQRLLIQTAFKIVWCRTKEMPSTMHAPVLFSAGMFWCVTSTFFWSMRAIQPTG